MWAMVWVLSCYAYFAPGVIFAVVIRESFHVQITLYLIKCAPPRVVSSPDPTLCEGKGLVTFERFLGSCKLSSLVFG